MKSLKLLLMLCAFPFISLAGDGVCNMKKAKKVFSKCAACHSVNKGGATILGPNLFGVVGRESGAVQSFPYSPALIDYKKTWTEAELHKFIENPMKVVPGTMMAFRGLKKIEDRNAVICLLEENK
ncbi:MAG: cytochrome c family protein [Oceanobacter sp.]|nr:MAG: cytochrome c family protein [Oceanobacter sp.]